MPKVAYFAPEWVAYFSPEWVAYFAPESWHTLVRIIQQELARFAKAISHPARLAILKYLAETKTCISGDISDYLPLGRTTVSQHLQELKRLGLIHGSINGLKVNYCLFSSNIEKYLLMFESFFEPVRAGEINCDNVLQHESDLSEITSTIKNY